ncbi:MAG: DUF3500 domain-containing protein [Acidimicrobiales bacterium]
MIDPRHELARRMADETLAFLDSLDGAQRALAQRPFDHHDDRTSWFYTPTDHGGLTISAMRPAQQRLAHRLVASGLSRGAYNTVALVMGLENVLDVDEGFRQTLGFERGRDPGRYFVRVFGEPGPDGPWGWRFGGHHVSINHLVLDGAVVSTTPCFLGCDPAVAPLLGPHLLRPLGAAEDLGRELVRSLDEQQLASAMLSPVPPTDVVSANRAQYATGDGDLPKALGDVFRGELPPELAIRFRQAQAHLDESLGITAEHLESVRLTTEPRGVSAGALRADQREILRALLDVYVGRIPDALAATEAAKYAADDDLAALSFAWAGSLEPAHGHYYRVQGPELLAEYDNTQRGANHVHTVWRDPRADFGRDVLAAHYAAVDPTTHGHTH